MKNAEITAFLSLIFILLVTFIGGVVDAASIQVAKNYRRADAERAMECVFAEYQKELLEEYDVFALDAGYESGKYSANLLDKRLEYYGLVNSENTIERIQFLSDGSAKAFMEQVSFYMEHKYGLNLIEDYLGKTEIWERQESEAEAFAKEEIQNKNYLEDLLKENEGELPKEDNPISHVEGLKQTPVLDLVMPEGKTVSEKTVSSSELVSRRERNQGYGDFSDESKSEGTTDKLLLGEYILEHFYSYMDEADTVLDYEVEYMIAGKESDRENLKSVVNELLLLRFVPNYTYLQGSADKKAEAKALALTLCSVLAVPAITEAAAQGILLAWAFGESLVDMRALLNGDRVPLIKGNSSWQLSLSGLMKLGESGDVNDGADDKDGLRYEDYLMILLFLEKREEIGMRCLDLIEQNLRKIHGLEFFRADTCVTKLEIKSRCSFRRGITYTFQTYFGYQ